jgi:hypothetical protein
MPKLIIESEYVERDDVKAVMKLFESNNVLQYSEIRRGLGLKKSEFKPYDTRPIKYEIELVRVLKRLASFEILLKAKVGRDSFYRLNPKKLQEKFSTTKKRFADIKKDKKGIEREIIEYRERNMTLILENTKLKERLAQYEGAWAIGQG